MTGVIHYNMSVTDNTPWVTVKIERPLTRAIDSHIAQAKRYGTRKYLSRNDFVNKACAKVLELEGGIKEAVAR